jgi:hypothetical protein
MTHGPGYIYHDATAGAWDQALYTLGILKHESVRQLHWSINCWEEHDFQAWKRHTLRTVQQLLLQ